MAMKLRAADSVSVAFIGDGTLGEGVVYETLNLASLWKLPLVIVCEDNAWSQSTPKSLNMAGTVAQRFEAFDVPVTELDTTDVREIADAARDVIAKTRRGGPQALLIHTYRLCHHSKNDDNRPAEEVDHRWTLDPLRIHGARILEAKVADIQSEVTNAMIEVVSEARASLSTQRL